MARHAPTGYGRVGRRQNTRSTRKPVDRPAVNEPAPTPGLVRRRRSGTEDDEWDPVRKRRTKGKNRTKESIRKPLKNRLGALPEEGNRDKSHERSSGQENRTMCRRKPAREASAAERRTRAPGRRAAVQRRISRIPAAKTASSQRPMAYGATLRHKARGRNKVKIHFRE